MPIQKKSIKFGLLLIIVFAVGAGMLLLNGNDAITLAAQKKAGTLTSEQINVAFEKVSGKLLKEYVTESQEVKKDDILMELDSTDTDLAIAQLTAKIAQLDAQIRKSNDTIRIGYQKVSTKEQQLYRDIEQQKQQLDSAAATLNERQLDYNRMNQLFQIGAISRSYLDTAITALSVAEANYRQQRGALDKLSVGVSTAEKTRILASGNAEGIYLDVINQERQDLDNSKIGIEQLMHQKKELEVQLQALQVEKSRLTLRSPEDGKILKIISEPGEMVQANSPVILLESKRFYYDIYLSEQQVVNLKPGDSLTGRAVALRNKEVPGTIRFITVAPGFANLKMSREKSSADLSSFQIRIYVQPESSLLPGMTIEVDEHEFSL